MKDIVIVGGVRTPTGTHGGALRTQSAVDLGVLAFKTLIAQTGVDPALFDDVVLGWAEWGWLQACGFLAVIRCAANVVGGFVVTDRMREMFKRKPGSGSAGQKRSTTCSPRATG